MPERVARLKAFPMRCEVSGNLIFSARWEVCATGEHVKLIFYTIVSEVIDYQHVAVLKMA